MNINFNKTDRLIQIIEEAADSINFFEKWMQHLTRIKELSNTGYYITTDKKKVDVNIPDSEIIDKKKETDTYHQEIILASRCKDSIYLPR